MNSDEPVSPAPARAKKREDTAEGCRSMARDDRTRAEESDSERMRFQLACSAEAWTSRADMLDRMEDNRVRMEGQSSARPAAGKNNKEISNG